LLLVVSVAAVIAWAGGFVGDRQTDYSKLAVRRDIPRHPIGPLGGCFFLFLTAASFGGFCAFWDGQAGCAIGLFGALFMELAISLTYVCGVLIGLIFILPLASISCLAFIKVKEHRQDQLRPDDAC